MIPTAPRTGYSTIPRGETGFIMKCNPTLVRPKALDGICCANLPVLTAEQKETDTPVNFLKSFSHELTSVCSPVVCSDYIPVVYFNDGGDPICQTVRGLEHCDGGEILEPSLVTWLRSHFVSLINEITTSSNYQNSVFNTISTNTIKCRGLSECAAAQPLDTATQVEFERATSSTFMFYMTQNVLGIAVTYCCYILAAASLSQAVLGLLLKLQQTVCRRNRKKCSCCEALICLFTNLDSYLNPLSMTKAQVDKRIGQINMHLQERNARGARKDVEMEALRDYIAE